MELNEKFNELESQIKLLKNEVKETLLDIRETILNYQNPFTTTELSPPVEVIKREENTVNTELIGQKAPDEDVEKPIEQVEKAGVFVPEVPVERALEVGGKAKESQSLPKAPSPVSKSEDSSIPLRPVQADEPRNGTLDLTSIAGLARWADSAINRIGRRRIEAIVEIYRMTGHLSPGLDEVLLQLTQLADAEEPEGRITMRECIVVLVQLESLLGRGGRSETALLSLLLDEKEDSYYR